MTDQKSTLPQLFALALFCLLAAGCAQARSYTDADMTRKDSQTEYAVEETDSGFILTVEYERYQWFPESDAVDAAGVSQLLSLAYEISDQRGRPIKKINEQRIEKSLGRNIFTGITSWAGTVKVFWAEGED